ncbi:MAG: thermonuclease family protein [Patescibacteria group bacterium]
MGLKTAPPKGILGMIMNRKLRRAVISLLIIIFLIAGEKAYTSLVPHQSAVEGVRTVATPTSIQEQNGLIKVTKVVDGDTLHVILNGKNQTIRVIGIDTPETVDPRKPVQCMGKAASDRAKELLLGKYVFLESDPTQSDKDKYGRLLRYVFINGSDDYGLGALEEGMAHEYTYAMPYKYQAEYKKAEKAAIAARIGLWADNACN